MKDEKISKYVNYIGVAFTIIGVIRGFSVWTTIVNTWENLNPWRFVAGVSSIVVIFNVISEKLKEFKEIKQIVKTTENSLKETQGTLENSLKETQGTLENSLKETQGTLENSLKETQGTLENSLKETQGKFKNMQDNYDFLTKEIYKIKKHIKI